MKSRPANVRFILRLIVFGIVATLYFAAVPQLLKGWLDPAAYAGFIGVWQVFYTPVLIAFGVVAVYTAFCRRVPRGFMRDYLYAARENGFASCPRCGARMKEKFGKESYQVKVGEKITTTTFSDGSKSEKREDIHESRTRDYRYFACTNYACQLSTDKNMAWNWQISLPYKRKEIRALTSPDAPLPKNRPNARSIITMRFGAPIVCVLFLAAMSFSVWSFNKLCTVTEYDIKVEAQGEPSAVTAEILAADDRTNAWSVSVSEYDLDYVKYVTFRSEREASVKHWHQADGTEVYDFRFDGVDLGTGLDGEYSIATIDGKLSVVDDQAQMIYPQGLPAFDDLYAKLSPLTYDALLTPLTAQVVGGEYGMNGDNLILKNGDASLAYGEHIGARFMVQSGQSRIRYVADAYDDNAQRSYEVRDYTIAGAQDVALDELGKLLADTSYMASIEIYENHIEQCDISYERNLKEHSLEFDGDYGQFKKGSYIFTEGADTILHRVFNGDTNNFDDTTITVAENKGLYDGLVELIPENYLRREMDMSKASKFNLIGIITTYTMEDADGNDTATMSLFFGKLNKLIHYKSDSERVEILWS